jgi:hypothetical protein
MLILTEQMGQLGGSCAAIFLDRLTAFVRAELGGDVPREAIAGLVERAGGYGFTLQSTIATFVITARLLGDDFDLRVPAARALLLDTAPEEIRAFALEELAVSLVSPPPPEPPPEPPSEDSSP